MKQALGMVEIQGLSVAVVAADAMVKAANVRILEIENAKGLGYMTIKVTGDVGAVNASVSAGRQIGMMNQKLVSWKVIARPSDYVEQTFCGSGDVPEAEKPVVKQPKPKPPKAELPVAEPVKPEVPKAEVPVAEPVKPEAPAAKQPKSEKAATEKAATAPRKKGPQKRSDTAKSDGKES